MKVTSGVALKNSFNCSTVRSRISSMLITILVMINSPRFDPSPGPSGSFLGGNTCPVQAHTSLDKAWPFAPLGVLLVVAWFACRPRKPPTI